MRLISVLNCLMTLLPDFLRLTVNVATNSPRLLIVMWLTPFYVGFPPTKHYTLIWAHYHSHPCPFGASPLPISQGGLSRTTRRPDSCVSLRLRLHDTQLPYSTSCHTTHFRQRCKKRITAPAGQVSNWKAKCPSGLRLWDTLLPDSTFPPPSLPFGRDASHHCPVPPLATRTAECLSGCASMTHSCRISFPTIPHTLGSGTKGAPLPPSAKSPAGSTKAQKIYLTKS